MVPQHHIFLRKLELAETTSITYKYLVYILNKSWFVLNIHNVNQLSLR